MSKTYVKECDYCKHKIEMSDREGGRWLPYNLDNGPHDCRSKTNGNGNGNGNQNNGKVTADKPKDRKQVTLEQVQKKLQSIGITIDLDKLMNQN